MIPLLQSHRQPVAWNRHGPIDGRTFLGDVYHLSERLPTTGNAILNVCEDRYRFLVTLTAGLVCKRPNLLPPSTVPEALKQVVSDRERPVCVTDGVPCPEGVACVEFHEPPGCSAPSERIPAFSGDQIMAEVFTSGSTGRPRSNPKRWGEMVSGATRIGRRLGLDQDERGSLVATVPPQHMFGLETSIMLGLRWGWGFHTGRPFFPRNLAEALSEVPEPRILITTPLHLRACIAEKTALPGLRFILSATAPLSTEMARTAERQFGCPVQEIYGSTETGAMASRRSAEGTGWEPFEGFRIHREGSHWLAEADHLSRPVRLDDRLKENGDGTLELLGRTADLVKIAGKRGSLGDLNHKLHSIDGVEDGTFLVPHASDGDVHRLAAVVVAPTRTKRELLQERGKRIDPVFLPRPLQCVKALPRNASGKLSRERLLKLLSKT